MSDMNGDLFPLRVGVGQYLARWYATLYGDTKATTEFAERGAKYAIKLVPGRMIDDVESMLASYERDQQGEHGANAKLPVVFVALGREYQTTGADWAGKQIARRLVRLTDADDASIYGYRQAMHDTRMQIAILAAEEMSARSLAAQFGLFVGDLVNRRFKAPHTFGQYAIDMPVMVENPDIIFASAGEHKTMTILVGDLTLKATIPYFDAPKAGEQNDGSANNPPGYPTVTAVSVAQLGREATVDDTGVGWTPQAEDGSA